MGQLVITGPVIDDSTQNAVLRDALLLSPDARATDPSDYYTIEVGVRDGAYTSWIGTFDQSTQSLDASTPTSVLNDGRPGMRLAAGQTLVVRVTSYGCPGTLRGARVAFTLGLVGGRTGVSRPLVAAGASIAEPNSRVAIAALERQINTGGLSDWEVPVDLLDPVEQVEVGAFQGRLQRDGTTQISLQRYSGGWVEVNGESVPIPSTGFLLLSTDGLLSSGGNVTTTAPSSSTLYHVYVGVAASIGQIRLCATAPSVVNGVYYLGSTAETMAWRFCGWVRTNSSTQFTDSTTDRLVINFYNRRRLNLLARPGYSDGDTASTHTSTSTTWEAANGGTNATCSYIANGEDAYFATAFGRVANSGANTSRLGIGDNTTTGAIVASIHVGTTAGNVGCTFSTIPAAGYRTLSLLVSVSAGTATYTADDARNGSAVDPTLTGMCATVMG